MMNLIDPANEKALRELVYKTKTQNKKISIASKKELDNFFKVNYKLYRCTSKENRERIKKILNNENLESKPKINKPLWYLNSFMNFLRRKVRNRINPLENIEREEYNRNLMRISQIRTYNYKPNNF